MAELKLTNNPCKYCNGEIDEGKPLCGDIVNDGDVVNTQEPLVVAVPVANGHIAHAAVGTQINGIWR